MSKLPEVQGDCWRIRWGKAFSVIGHAADLLGELGSAAQPAIADLQGLLGHDHESTRRHVRTAIDKIEVS